MYYFIAWAVFLGICSIALIIAAVMDKGSAPAAAAGFDEEGDGQQEYEQYEEDPEPLAEGDAFADAGDGFAAEGMPEAGEPVADDFSAFEEEFN